MNFLEKIEEVLLTNETNNVYIFSHRKHDGDAKGSALALESYFKNKGYNSKYIISNEDYLLIDIFGKVKITNEVNEKFIAICVDTSTEDIVENDIYLKATLTFKIDHHKGDEFCNYNYIDTSASSTCEVLAYLMKDEDITAKIATYLFTGIFTDTRGKHNMSANTYMQMAKLIEKGADHNFIVTKTSEVSTKRKKIAGLIATRFRYYGTDLVGCVIHDPKDYDSLSVARGVNELTDLKAKIFFCIVKSKTSNEIFVEVRSSNTSNIDVSEIARKYGGGGLVHASGFSLYDDKYISAVIAELKGLLIFN